MSPTETLRGIVLDETLTLTLDEVCEVCGVTESIVIEMIDEGVAEPLDANATKLAFSGVAVTRMLTAYRLQRDLQINIAGAALALDLLDEISALKGKGR